MAMLLWASGEKESLHILFEPDFQTMNSQVHERSIYRCENLILNNKIDSKLSFVLGIFDLHAHKDMPGKSIKKKIPQKIK
jgi:hypothetical protein